MEWNERHREILVEERDYAATNPPRVFAGSNRMVIEAIDAALAEIADADAENARLHREIARLTAENGAAVERGRLAVCRELTEAVLKFNNDSSMGIGQLIDVIAPWLDPDERLRKRA